MLLEIGFIITLFIVASGLIMSQLVTPQVIQNILRKFFRKRDLITNFGLLFISCSSPTNTEATAFIPQDQTNPNIDLPNTDENQENLRYNSP